MLGLSSPSDTNPKYSHIQILGTRGQTLKPHTKQHVASGLHEPHRDPARRQEAEQLASSASVVAVPWWHNGATARGHPTGARARQGALGAGRARGAQSLPLCASQAIKREARAVLPIKYQGQHPALMQPSRPCLHAAPSSSSSSSFFPPSPAGGGTPRPRVAPPSPTHQPQHRARRRRATSSRLRSPPSPLPLRALHRGSSQPNLQCLPSPFCPANGFL